MQKSSDEQQGMGNEPSTQHLNPGTHSYPFDPRFYGMQPEQDEIDLWKYWRVLWKRRLLIVSVVIATAVLAAGYSLTLPNIYRAEVIVTPVGGGGKGVSMGGLGGLASLAGISLGADSSLNVNRAILKSNKFIQDYVRKSELKGLLFPENWNNNKKTWRNGAPSSWKVYQKINGMLSVSPDETGSLITIAVEDTDPDLAAQLANDVVARFNHHLRQEALNRSKERLGYLNDELGKVNVEEMRQALFGLISQEQKKAMLANTQKDFAFRVLDAAMVPERRAGPNRTRIVILSAILAGFLAMVAVFVWDGIHNAEERRRAKI